MHGRSRHMHEPEGRAGIRSDFDTVCDAMRCGVVRRFSVECKDLCIFP